ncbi:28S ribosomal protein S25, mitochondrial isoform X2 [Eublepharis macularius]|uniref:Small ribosomal subunit protein mS25 n=1 Tax=Eublepharis macularius TaxID=481883 RepID=A0AA97KWK5_EUBMA|nr:28S ribosomal protein S25, mitochondrial isoform X2 [Eublepharis macularius]
MPMKGRFPIRRTLQYLSQGDVIFKDAVKIQYKNPWLQIVMFKNMTPSPFVKFYLDTGEQVLVDVEEKTNKEIVQHIKKILGKSEETLQKETKEKMKLRHPATFGPRKYHLRECMCEIKGQIPCPGEIPLPKEMRGKYKAAMKENTVSEANSV